MSKQQNQYGEQECPCMLAVACTTRLVMTGTYARRFTPTQYAFLGDLSVLVMQTTCQDASLIKQSQTAEAEAA